MEVGFEIENRRKSIGYARSLAVWCSSHRHRQCRGTRLSQGVESEICVSFGGKAEETINGHLGG